MSVSWRGILATGSSRRAESDAVRHVAGAEPGLGRQPGALHPGDAEGGVRLPAPHAVRHGELMRRQEGKQYGATVLGWK